MKAQGLLLRVLPFVMALTLFSPVLSAATPPAFDDFPVAVSFHQHPVSPVLSTPEVRRFRTVLRQGVDGGPNFADHYTLVSWGCGSGCVSWAIVDARDGSVWRAPFKLATPPVDFASDPDFDRPLLDFRLDSDLIIVAGERNGLRHVNGKLMDGSDGFGIYYYRWHDKKLSLVHAVEKGKR